MDIGSQTVLITGGASGIGWGLAQRFAAAGSEVILCGRRAEKLPEAVRQHPRIQTRACDLAREPDRVALAEWVGRDESRINVLVNNAGIQNRIAIAGGDWNAARAE